MVDPKAAAERLAGLLEADRINLAWNQVERILQPFLEAFAKEVREEQTAKDLGTEWDEAVIAARDAERTRIAAWHREKAEEARKKAEEASRKGQFDVWAYDAVARAHSESARAVASGEARPKEEK